MRFGFSISESMDRLRSCVSPTWKCKPSRPSRTSSAIPPMLEVMTGAPDWKASWIVKGEFSNQMLGTITTSRVERIRSRSSFL